MPERITGRTRTIALMIVLTVARPLDPRHSTSRAGTFRRGDDPGFGALVSGGRVPVRRHPCVHHPSRCTSSRHVRTIRPLSAGPAMVPSWTLKPRS
jgi:hypothetical protein